MCVLYWWQSPSLAQTFSNLIEMQVSHYLIYIHCLSGLVMYLVYRSTLFNVLHSHVLLRLNQKDCRCCVSWLSSELLTERYVV